MVSLPSRKINVDSQNSDHRYIKSQQQCINHDQEVQPQPGTSSLL